MTEKSLKNCFWMLFEKNIGVIKCVWFISIYLLVVSYNKLDYFLQLFYENECSLYISISDVFQ